MRQLRLSVPLFSVLAAALVGVHAVPLRVSTPRDNMVVKHKWEVIPDNWFSMGPPPDDTTIDLLISLQPNQKDALTNVLLEVSQPGHPKYGAHLSMEEVAELVAPHPETLDLVTSWLEYNGVPTSSISTTLAGAWLAVADVPVSQANDLLGASYQLYYHAGRNDTILRTAGYALPASLHVHVKTVVPTTAFTSSRLLQQTSRSRSGEAAAPNVTSGEPVNMLSRRQQEQSMNIYPSTLRSMYKTETYVPNLAQTNSILGIVGSDNEYPNLNELSAFLYRFRSNPVSQSVTFKPVDQNMPAGFISGRANLFTQYAAAMAFPISIYFYNGTGPAKYSKKRKIGQGDDVVLQWLKYTVGRHDIPQTIALMTEGTRESSLTKEYAESVCKMFEVLGANGVTVLVASGDGGVGAGRCKNFYVNFPASCPFVTTVGGTTGIPPASEVGFSLSGGGFSQIFDTPDFQKIEVGDYIKSIKDTHINRYQPTGRAIPDIALASSRYTYIAGGKEVQMDSTSCSLSTAAGIFSLLNDYRLLVGMTPLGWANPWIYGAGSYGFTDITSGHNPGCGTQGFDAKVGWDPVTGLGSPEVKLLINILHPLIQPPQPELPQPQRWNQSLGLSP